MNATVYIWGILLQAVAGIIALLQARHAPRRLPWLLIAISSLLIVARRIATLDQFIKSGRELAAAEVLTLVISFLFFLGVVLMSSMFRDIVNGHRALQESKMALQESEKAFRNLFEEHSAVKLVIDPDTGAIVSANKAAANFYGWSLETLERMSIQQINAMPYSEVKDAMKTVLNINQTHFEFQHRLADGLIRDVEVFSSRVTMHGHEYLHSIIHDITERKLAEEELQRTLESLRKAVATTIQVMVSAVETRDPYTAGHQLRVADLARAIAEKMGLPREKIDGIRVAGSIHDIGKLSIPAEILSKPTTLTNIEFSLVKEHPRIGYEILKDVESSWPLAQIVHQHHERMNGTGYPRSLEGNEILIEARIIAVADVVESMASHRPYRPALGIEKALEEIQKNKGILYDNAVADACLRLFQDKDFQLEKT